ncbi:MAG TPA: S46 family peptidase [Sphingobacteriaceae bacterium]|nr:S46 family peptidase [Sphingobacteriaceae bacterium]
MKRTKILSLLLLSCLVFTNNLVKADEGMWLPMLIGKNYEQMKKQGFKLTPEDLYSVNKASIKDAIVSFGGFCTGEMVSKNGLIFTNHHCGYDAIASNSTPENNILDNGWYAKSYSEEKPIPGLFVRYLIRMEDVTPQITNALKGVSEADKAVRIAELTRQIAASATTGTYEGEVRDIYKANQFLLFVYERYNDVRLVGTPPQSIGKFGGDTDNWEWPRHTGDFSIFRVYANTDNKPAQYAASNKPYTPKKFLPVSIKGVKNGDFAMVYGFPGRTDRYLTSFGVTSATERTNPAIVKLRDIRLKAWKEEMDKSVDTRLKLSSEYANIANYWKYYIGQTEQLKRLKIAEQKQQEEAAFIRWAANKPEYASLIKDYETVYKSYEPYAAHSIYAGSNGLLATAWVRNTNAFMGALTAMEARKDDQAYIARVNGNITAAVDDYETTFNDIADKKIFAQILTAFYNDIPKAQHPRFLTLISETYWDRTPEATFKKYADFLWEKSAFIRPNTIREFWKKPNRDVLEKDPGYLFAKNLVSADYIKANFGTTLTDFETTKSRLDNLYLKALMEQNKDKAFFPDANSTMRISYGQVQGYSPKDGVAYNIQTTIDGMIAKYQPGDDEFDLPQNLLDAYKRKDFREYGSNGTLGVGFISNNDITGGNSGSPVINGNGELIGLAFDGNWEAMSGDIAFDKNYKRTISVDVRFVLWCIDVLGGAKNLINELDIRRPVTTTARK